MDNIIIEESYNTNYFNTLLVSILYSSTTVQELFLDNIPINLKSIYLQELIREKFVKKINKGHCIFSNTINEIRNMCYVLGYLDYNITELLEEKKIELIYSFFIKFFNIPIIRLKYNNTSKQIPYIELDIHNNSSIKNNLHDWIKNYINYDNVTNIQFKSIPILISIKLNRLHDDLLVDIKKRIKVFKNCGEFDIFIWTIYSVICYDNEKQMYYSLLYNNNKWKLYNKDNTPSIKNIKLNDLDFKEKIMKECEFLIYKN
jgi:hypothetical protein